MKKHPASWLTVLAVLILTATQGCGSTDEQLPKVVVDRSECAKCRMLISDARFAALMKTDKYLMFDDIGCMLRYEQTLSPKELKGMWVRDYFHNTWIPENEAIFYRLTDISTPMEYGYIAATRKDPEPALVRNAALRYATSKELHNDYAKRFASEAK